MPSPIDGAKMVPASENDLIKPGSLYFACLNLQEKSQPKSYWIVLRAPREWLPDGFIDTRPVQHRVFPFWVVGKDQRVWLSRTSLFQLDRSQREIFSVRNTRLEFTNMLILIDSFQNAEAALAHFQRRILDSTKQYNESRESDNRHVARTSTRRTRSSSPVADQSPANSAMVVARNADNRTVGPLAVRSHKANIIPAAGRDSQPQLPLLSQHPQRAPSSISAPRTQRHSETDTWIKTEEEEQNIDNMAQIRVAIYVGPVNTIKSVNAVSLERMCPFLHSLVNVNHATGERYIMHPMLSNVNPNDFDSVATYINTGDYHPVARTIRDENNGSAHVVLEGHGTSREYSDTLVKAASLYIIAKTFQIQGLDKLVEHKVCGVPHHRYEKRAFVQFATILLTRRVELFAPGSVDPNSINLDYIDVWTFKVLAGWFTEIMKDGGAQAMYWQFVEATRERRFHAGVLRQAASEYAQYGGQVPVVID